MGNLSLGLVDPFSAQENLSSLPYSDSSAVVLGIQNRSFFKELSTLHLSGIKSLQNHTFGLSLTSKGTSDFNERIYSIMYGKLLWQGLSIGSKINLNKLNQAVYGNAFFLNFDLGLRLTLSKELTFSFLVKNPIDFNFLQKDTIQLTTVNEIKSGFLYQKDNLTIGFEIKSDTRNNLGTNLGVEWNYRKLTSLRLGLSLPEQHLTAGMGINLKPHIIDFFYQYHFILNPNVGVGYTYVF